MQSLRWCLVHVATMTGRSDGPHHTVTFGPPSRPVRGSHHSLGPTEHSLSQRGGLSSAPRMTARQGNGRTDSRVQCMPFHPCVAHASATPANISDHLGAVDRRKWAVVITRLFCRRGGNHRPTVREHGMSPVCACSSKTNSPRKCPSSPGVSLRAQHCGQIQHVIAKEGIDALGWGQCGIILQTCRVKIMLPSFSITEARILEAKGIVKSSFDTSKRLEMLQCSLPR